MFHCQTLLTRGMLTGVSDAKDYNTNEVVGATLQIGSRNASGRFSTINIKVNNVSASDFVKYLDSIVTLTLTDASISAYLNGNNAQLSVKAQAVKVATA